MRGDSQPNQRKVIRNAPAPRGAKPCRPSCRRPPAAGQRMGLGTQTEQDLCSLSFRPHPCRRMSPGGGEPASDRRSQPAGPLPSGIPSMETLRLSPEVFRCEGVQPGRVPSSTSAGRRVNLTPGGESPDS
jgi:hypothetical protein